MANESRSLREGAAKPAAEVKVRPAAALAKNKATNRPAEPAVETAPPALEPAPGDTIDGGATQPLMNETVDINPTYEARGIATVNLDPGDAEPDSNPPPKAAEKGATMLGDFRLLKKLGQGGMGAVFKAHQASLDRIVAVKVLSKDLMNKKEFVARFKREAILMAKLDHPNVLRCFEVREDKGFHFIAIEYVEGGSVEGWLKKLGRLSIGDALHIVLRTLEALQHAHERSMIHRDIKPDNLLLTKDGIVKVADMGLAKDTDSDVSLTKSGAGAGTPIYMAPEQAYNVKHVDQRVDIYAVGIMLYVFLTGRPPFEGTTPIELVVAKEKGKFDPIRKYNGEVPPKIDLIVDKMLAKDPKQRYETCQQVIDDLEPLGLANDSLSFLGNATATAPKRTSKPAAVARTDAKSPAAPTKSPEKASPKPSAAEVAEKDVWYWNVVTKSGQVVPKKVTTDQIKTLIKAGHLDAEAQISKTLNSGYRNAATYMEFHGLFQSKETVTKANVKGQKYREIYKEVEAADARKRRWGWLGKTFHGAGRRIVGLIWMLLVLGLAGAAGWYFYKTFIATP